VPSRSSKFGRDSLERKPILDAVRVPVERLLGIKVVFVVERMTMFGDWASPRCIRAPKSATASTIGAR
jgi:hypothetical protein